MIEEVLALAARAPSAHNTQPWMVRVNGARLAVVGDSSRWLRHGDSSRRDFHLSLGAFAEAVRLAFHARGVRADPAPSSPDEGGDEPEGATTRLLLREGPVSSSPGELEAASLLRRRGTSRLRYSPRPLAAAVLAQLQQAAAAAGLDLHLVENPSAGRQDLNSWHHAAAREAWLDPRAVAELRCWLRFDPEGALRPEDGLSTHCLGLTPLQTAAMAALVRPGIGSVARGAYLAPLIASALARAETRTFESSPAVGVLIAPEQAATMGGSLLRVWLAATRLRLSLAPSSAVLDRRGWELARSLGVSPARIVAVFRLGHSAPPPRSGRRAVPRFASFFGAPLDLPGIAVASATDP